MYIIVIIDIIYIIDKICIFPWQSKYQCSLFRVWHIYVPYHPKVLRAHQNHFCLLVRREGRGFQIDEHETQTETLQTCQAEQRECHKCPTCQHFHAWFCGNQGHRIPHAGPQEGAKEGCCMGRAKAVNAPIPPNIVHLIDDIFWNIGFKTLIRLCLLYALYLLYQLYLLY